ncbi:DUF4296 domain-containing protein [Flavobacterium algicola]|uniref:DUF4296 domain-containing protein n=1 Tax=Flavobacterium algicola TaxID=556529 RepID=UPI001EFE3BC7|nr:DUF4296 domain-containing protein [Flavobacterium algicola]MCG9792166.1 DUF4296 domain-containing protein [Flavobacterium algicola]
MKKIGILLFLFFWVGCKDQVMEKPDNLIDKKEMVDILYDLSLLNVIRYQNAATLQKYKGTELEYIFKKYNIDSVQFSKSNSYYAADYKNYKDIFDQVKVRIESDLKKVDTLIRIKERADSLKTKKSKTIKNDSVAKKTNIKEKLEQAPVETEGVLN